MDGHCLIRGALAGMLLGALVYQPGVSAQEVVQEPQIEQPSAVNLIHEEPGHIHAFIDKVKGYVDPDNAEVISVHQLACLIDHLDKSLFCRGQVVVKNPDVWGQNRLTQYRAEYEDQMKGQVGNFEVILNGYQRRADLAALTSATSVGASVGPQISNSRNVSTTTTSTPAQSAPAIPSAVGLLGPNGLAANANTLIGTMSPLLMPSNLTALALANKGATPGIGIEPTVLLDERSNFLNHLHQLRRNSAGDDRSDLPGYGLYLVRMPVSILPGDQSIRGKGAVVTVQAKHGLTHDLLANTFRNVVILDTAYQLMDAVTRGQYLPISDDQDIDCEKDPYLSPFSPKRPCDREVTGGRDSSVAGHGANGQKFSAQAAMATPIARSGSTSGSQGSAPASEVVPIYGDKNLKKLVCAVKVDQESWFRHDPSVVSWLLGELASAHDYMREQARSGNPLFQPTIFENIGNLAVIRDYQALKFHREKWLQELAKQRNEVADKLEPSKLRVRPIDILAYALMIQSVFVDRQLKYDMKVMAQRKGCPCGDPYQFNFYDLCPDEATSHAFNVYVECKWPIHVFSLDPIIDQQNQLDLYSERTELQLALATAVASGQASFENATSYARRLEKDLASIALNRTAVGFGAGEATFGWRFYPRLQSPPTQSNPQRILGILVNNGPGPDYGLKNLQIEPGQRECYALMVVPNFASAMKLTTVTNWFDLKTRHPDQELETTDMVRLGRKLQTARNAMQRLCDSGRYRPVELEVLRDRLNQLEAMLPMQSHDVLLPFEADLTGSEIFSSTTAGLGPRLLTWYGEPGNTGGTIFILGSGFSVRDMKVIVGGVQVPDSASAGASPSSFDIVSRNVLRVDIPSNATPIRTPVVFRDPSFVCNHQGKGLKGDGTCGDCAALKAGASDFGAAVRAVDSVVYAAQAEVNRITGLGTAGPSPANGAKSVAIAARAMASSIGQEKTSQTAVNAASAVASAAEAAANATMAKPEVVAQAARSAAEGFKTANTGTAPTDCECKQRWVLDVHVATSNGISNHLFVEVPDPATNPATTPKTYKTTVTTVSTPNASNGSTTTNTTFEVPIQGSGLPAGTFLPLGTGLPAGGTFFAPGAATINAVLPQPPSAAPAPAAGTSITPKATSTETERALDTELNPVTGGLLPGAVDRSVPSQSVPPPAVNMAIAGRGNLAVPPPAPMLPVGSLRSTAPTPGLLRAGVASLSAGNPGQKNVAAVRNLDPNIQPTAAKATRTSQGRLFTRSQSTKPEPSTSKPVTNASPQPTPRRSLLSRVLGGDQ